MWYLPSPNQIITKSQTPGTSKGWTETNPKIHAEKATAANEAFNGEWKGIVRMAKSWNQHHG